MRAIDAYRELILRTAEPNLTDVIVKLGQIADREGNGELNDRPDLRDEAAIVSVIDESEPEILQRLRKEIRLRGLALRTENAYVGWVRRFLADCGGFDAENYGADEIRGFLTLLAVDRKVAPSTSFRPRCRRGRAYSRIWPSMTSR